MMNKWLVVLALAGIPIASAKSYDVTIATPCVAHNVRLTPGEYRLKVDGSNAIFTDANGNSYKTPVTIQQASKKSDDTEVETKKVAGQDRIEEIRLHGSRMKLEFN